MGMTYLLAAFSVTWIILFLYLLSLTRQQRRLERELDTLKRAHQENSPS
jgi:CcmD family protein